jgi:hypothetical protein
MRFFTAILLVLSWALVSTGKEFFVLQGIDKTHPDDVLVSPGVDGFTIRVSWRKLHEEGFAWLDEQISRGEELDTNIQLRVLAGTNAPTVLAGVEYFDYASTDSDGLPVIRRVPVPWDSTMHGQWENLAAELGTRYGGNPRIKVVHVPSFGNSSELHMPVEVTQLAGYSSRGLAESWIAMAGPLASAFPSAIVSLNYATPTQAQITGADGDWLLEELADLATGRAGYQANDLAADVDLERNKYQTLIEQQELGRPIGFQMVSSSGTARFGGEFLEAVSIASQAGAQWLEMYAADIEHIPPTGDYNFDSAVDAADYVVWRKTLGQSGPGLAADGNGDERVTNADFGVWRAHFAEASPGVSITNAIVPEPSTAMLIIAAMAIVVGRRAACHRAPASAKLSFSL